MFLTNVFLMPLMATRANGDNNLVENSDDTKVLHKSVLDITFGIVGLAVGGFSLWYAFFGGDFESFGSPLQRLQYYSLELSSNRITIAFTVDVFLFSFFQYRLMQNAPKKSAWQKIPFIGLALWLIK